MVQSLPARGAAGRRKKMGAWMSRVWFLMFPAKKYKIVVVGLDDGKPPRSTSSMLPKPISPNPTFLLPGSGSKGAWSSLGKRWERACWGLEGVRPVENGMEAETEGARRKGKEQRGRKKKKGVY
uniref:Uncharacterized protein n=1 Tax=Oryza barthii TaxID=65489 RepID=A0A0D3HVV2_9ORYZ